MSTSAAPAAARHVPTSRDNAVSLPPAPKKPLCDRYPDVLVYAPLVATPLLEARLDELNRRAAEKKSANPADLVNPPGCRFHLQTDPAEIRNLLFLPKFAVVITVSAPPDKAETTKRLQAALDPVPRFCKRWLHVELDDLMGDASLQSVGRRIQCAFLHEAVQLDRAVQRPVVSIFTTTYRTGTRIRRAFQSLRRQTLVDWEWVLLDDSPDEGEHFDLLRKELLVGDHRVRLYRRNGNNGSIGDVKNECIGLCRGRYLMELDHDDELTPTCLADCADVFQRDPDVGFVYTDFANLFENSMHPFRYGEGYGLGLAGYYCRHVLSADPAVSHAGAEADRAFQDGSTWFSSQYVSVTPQVCPVSITHLVALPNHPRMWRRTTMEHMGSYPEFLPICDDQEILMRTQACGAKMVKLHTMGYLQYMNLPSNGSNFSGIRGQEICRMGSTGPLYKLFQEVHPSQDALFMEADCDPDMRFRGPRVFYHGWDREELPTYYNGLEHPDGDGVVVYLGMAAVVTRAKQFLHDLLGQSEAAAAKEEEEPVAAASTSLRGGHYATPVHGSTELCDRVVVPPARRRRRVVYVLSSDMGDMETLRVLTEWMKEVRPAVTQEELCLLRAYGFDFSDPAQRGLFRADWPVDKCLVQYARHMYAADAAFVRPDLPPLPSEEAIRAHLFDDDENVLVVAQTAAPSSPVQQEEEAEKVAEEAEEVAEEAALPAALAEMSLGATAAASPPMAFGADQLWMQVAAGAFRIVPVGFDAPPSSPTTHRHRHGFRSRLEVVQSFADPARTHYLEIGVETGALFNALRAASKTGVDPAPHPQFAVPADQAHCSRFFAQTADDYFLAPETAAREVHLAFVDGMHLAEYVARDVENASEAILHTLRRTAADGALPPSEGCWLLLDDVVPGNRAEQERVPRGAYHDRGVLKYGAPWTGDVWKAAAVLVRKYPRLERRLFLCPEEYRGVLALRLTADDEPLRLTAREVAQALALDFDRDFAAYLAEI